MPGVSGRLVADAVSAAPAGRRRALRAVVVGRGRRTWRAWPAPGDLVLTVGAGDVTMIGPEMLLRLEQGDVEGGRAGADRPGDGGQR